MNPEQIKINKNIKKKNNAMNFFKINIKRLCSLAKRELEKLDL